MKVLNLLPCRELTDIPHQTGKGKSSTQKCRLGGDMLVPQEGIHYALENSHVAPKHGGLVQMIFLLMHVNV